MNIAEEVGVILSIDVTPYPNLVRSECSVSLTIINRLNSEGMWYISQIGEIEGSESQRKNHRLSNQPMECYAELNLIK